MSNSRTPVDQQQLRAQIEQNRADLGETVEALAAKADVKARVREAASEATHRARHALGAVRTKAVDATGAAVDTGTVQVALVKDRFAEAGRTPAGRRVLSVAALVVTGAVLGVVAVVIYRKRAKIAYRPG
jgi:hypothetical protein